MLGERSNSKLATSRLWKCTSQTAMLWSLLLVISLASEGPACCPVADEELLGLGVMLIELLILSPALKLALFQLDGPPSRFELSKLRTAS